MPDPWTREQDVALVEAYLGYEVQRCGRSIVCIIDGRTLPLPDMRDRRHGWALDCLDSWLIVAPGRWVQFHQHTTTRERYVWLREYGVRSVTVGSGRTLNEAVAWALWKAREM